MINLLPPIEKEELKKHETLKIVLILGIIFSVFIFYIFLVLFTLKIYISGEAQAQKIILDLEEKKSETQQTQEFQDKIKNFNQKIITVDGFYKKQVSLTSVFEKFSAIFPKGAYLTKFNWKEDIFQVEIFGFVPQRENLFDIKNKLEEDDFFENVNFPPSNWVKSKDINFHAILKIKTVE